jgi:CheY-like chemotaxis protein
MAPRVLIVDDNAELLGLLVTVFEDAGYDVSQTQRAKPALEKIKTEKPDVAVVDILLPDLIGYEVAGALRQAKVPFVLMTGVFKGGRHSLDAVSRHGASGYFEKPFEIEHLVEKIASLVPPPPRNARRVTPAKLGARPDEEGVEIDMNVDIQPEEGLPSREISLTDRVSVMEASSRVSATLKGEAMVFQSQIHRRSDPALAHPSPRSIPPVMTPVSRPSFPPPSWPRVAAPASYPGPSSSHSSPSNSSPSLSGLAAPISSPAHPVSTPIASRIGQLKDNLPQLISAFYLAQETGELVVQRGKVRKVVYFEKGNPVFAMSNLATDRFGQFLVRTGKVQTEEFQAAAVVAEKTHRRTGDVLIEMGLLTETERMYYVGQQVKAIIYGLFAWEEGNWLLAFKRRARSETLKLDLHPANLIMRGVKKLYSPSRLVRLLPDTAVPTPAPDPNYLLSDVELEGWEATLLSRVDGIRTANALMLAAKRPPEQVRGLLVGLLSLKILHVAS